MSEEIKNVAADLAIRKLSGRYCDAIHRRDSETWASLWAEDAIWDFMGQSIEGRTNILATWEGAMAGFPVVYHVSHGAVINVDGDSANCRWYINEEIVDASGAPLRFVGIYNDICTRHGDEWLFQRRRFDPIYQGAGALNGDTWAPYPEDINHPPV